MASIKEVNAIPKLTSNTLPVGAATSSSIYSISYDSWYAFNQISDQGWASSGVSTPQWLSYMFASPVTIAQYSLSSRNSAVSTDISQTPKDWIFEGSHNGVDWVKLDERNENINWGLAEKRTFTFVNTVAYKHYRIYCTSNNGSTLAYAINELEMFEYNFLDKFLFASENKYHSVKQTNLNISTIPIMTSNTAPSGEVSASSQYSTSNYFPYLAFNGSVSNNLDAWISGNGVTSGWLQYRFSSPKTIIRYSITSRADVNNGDPKTWIFQGSNDGQTWINLDERIDEPVWRSAEERSYDVKSPTSFLIYRITVSAINRTGSGNYVSIGELKLYEDNSSLTELISDTRNNFENYGMDVGAGIKLNRKMKLKNYIVQTSSQLGKGNVFKQTIDTTRTPIQSASIT
ncbi:discoidin domain-containing protein [Paenibacillus sp. FSL K6-1230]|uniref:discoidin domain-containing protein n=1 Tax=Paenibacillus sp. FSL K6-1230 TaxID=2921603 RepID=UPI0003A9C55A